jgi:copper resistance protein B
VSRGSIIRAVLLAGAVGLGATAPASAQDPHAGHVGATPATPPPERQQPAATELPPFVPPLTDEDRKAAFPDVRGHAVHDTAVNYFVLLDQFEWQSGAGANGVDIDTRGWVGHDRDRLWFRAEGHGENGRVGDAQTHLMYGRQFSRWWYLVAGVRQYFRAGSPVTVSSFWVHGLSPDCF